MTKLLEMPVAPYMDGWRAHQHGYNASNNPYDDRYQRYSNAQWIAGWCARFDAIKHGHDMPLDEVYP